MSKKVREIIRLLLVTLLFSSCIKYSFSGSSLPSHIRSVSIPLFDNSTPKAGLEERIREKVWNTFQSSNLVSVQRAGGDAELSFSLDSYEIVANDYDETGNVKTNRIRIGATVKFTDKLDNSVLYTEKISATAVYSLSEESEENGISRIIITLSDMVLNNTLRGF